MSEPNVVIVTGGTYGIGRGITLELARRGHTVVAFGLNVKSGDDPLPQLEGTRNELIENGFKADVLEADVTRSADIEAVVRFTLEHYGQIDGLVNNAGIHSQGKVTEVPEEVWDRVMAVNVKGMFLTTRAVIPHMVERQRGSIVNIGSRALWGEPNSIAYCASKGGVMGFSFGLAHDYIQSHIRVNVVIPSGVLTGMTAGRSHLSTVARRSVGGRMAYPSDVAKTVAFLMSDDAELISGAIVNVNSFAVGAPSIDMPAALATS